MGEQHETEPTQTTGFDKVTMTGAHRVAINSASGYPFAPSAFIVSSSPMMIGLIPVSPVTRRWRSRLARSLGHHRARLRTRSKELKVSHPARSVMRRQDDIRFGIIVVLVIEIGLITLPIGLNVFVVKSVLPTVRLADNFRGVGFYVLALGIGPIAVYSIPSIATFLLSIAR